MEHQQVMEAAIGDSRFHGDLLRVIKESNTVGVFAASHPAPSEGRQPGGMHQHEDEMADSDGRMCKWLLNLCCRTDNCTCSGLK